MERQPPELEGAHAAVGLPQAQHDQLGLGMPRCLQGSPPRIRKPLTTWAWQVDETAHGGSLRSTGSGVNAQVGCLVATRPCESPQHGGLRRGLPRCLLDLLRQPPEDVAE